MGGSALTPGEVTFCERSTCSSSSLPPSANTKQLIQSIACCLIYHYIPLHNPKRNLHHDLNHHFLSTTRLYLAACCHPCRLRIGTFLYANVGASSRTGTQGSLSLLRGSLYPSCFSFQPPLCFEVVAFDGGRRWMVAVEYLPLALLLQNDAGEPELAEEQTQTERAEQQPSRPAEAFTATAQQQRQRRPSGDQQGGWEQQEDVPLTAAEWQQQQVQRLAAVQQLHSIAAAPLAGGIAGRPAALVPGGAGLRGRPASLLLSSAQLAAVHPEVRSLPSRLLALHSLGLPAFRAALSVHLNGLAAAPADASPQHVAQMAAAQRAHAVVAAARPPLCTEQLLAAFGPGWLDDWQVRSVLRSGVV